MSRPRRALSPPAAVGPAAATTTVAGPGPAAAAGAAPAAAAHVVAITVDVLRPPPADIALREDLEAEGFGDKDPRRFNFRRAWSSGGDDVVAGTDADNWSTAEFRAFVWGNADGRGDDIFRLIGTRDLVNEFDPDIGPRHGLRHVTLGREMCAARGCTA